MAVSEFLLLLLLITACKTFLFGLVINSAKFNCITGKNISVTEWLHVHVMLWQPQEMLNCVIFLLTADLHECCLAWLGHSHVTLPGHPALVLKLPHRQVKKHKNKHSSFILLFFGQSVYLHKLFQRSRDAVASGMNLAAVACSPNWTGQLWWCYGCPPPSREVAITALLNYSEGHVT